MEKVDSAERKRGAEEGPQEISLLGKDNRTELYRLMLDEHRFASEFRLRIVGGWGLGYAGFAVAFAWVYDQYFPEPGLSACIAFLALLFTLFMWAVDCRHRRRLWASMRFGLWLEGLNQYHNPKTDRDLFAPPQDGFFIHVDSKGQESTWSNYPLRFFGAVRSTFCALPRASHSALVDILSTLISLALVFMAVKPLWGAGVAESFIEAIVVVAASVFVWGLVQWKSSKRKKDDGGGDGAGGRTERGEDGSISRAVG